MATVCKFGANLVSICVYGGRKKDCAISYTLRFLTKKKIRECCLALCVIYITIVCLFLSICCLWLPVFLSVYLLIWCLSVCLSLSQSLSLSLSLSLFFSLSYLSHFKFTSDSPMFLPIAKRIKDMCPIDCQNVLLILWISGHLSYWVCLECETLHTFFFIHSGLSTTKLGDLATGKVGGKGLEALEEFLFTIVV